jgi:flap endonuclease-1
LIDLAILVGTDFNEGIRGVGPKKALKLVRTHGAIEWMPEDLRAQVPEFEAVRAIYRAPEVETDVRVEPQRPDEDGVVRMLCGARRFSETRVRAALDRLRAGREGR